jgi:hypothetical protein
MLPVQTGFFENQVIGNVRQKMEELYHNNPDSFTSEKEYMLAYWSEFERLQDVLGEQWTDFRDWFLKKATSPETITRCRRAMREEGLIKSDSEHTNQQEWPF